MESKDLLLRETVEDNQIKQKRFYYRYMECMYFI